MQLAPMRHHCIQMLVTNLKMKNSITATLNQPQLNVLAMKKTMAIPPHTLLIALPPHLPLGLTVQARDLEALC